MLSPQDLGQADMSVLRKAELRDRLASTRKAFDKYLKELDNVKTKQVSMSKMYLIIMLIFILVIWKGGRIFQEQWTSTCIHCVAWYWLQHKGLSSIIYFLIVSQCYWQILQSLIANLRKLDKTAYLFSIDSNNGQINHINVVSEQLRRGGLDAQSWAANVSQILGGKVSYFYIT